MSSIREFEAKVRGLQQAWRAGSVVDQEAAFPRFKAVLRIEDEAGKVAVAMTVTGDAAIVAETVKWTADAFQEDQER